MTESFSNREKCTSSRFEPAVIEQNRLRWGPRQRPQLALMGVW